MNYKELGLADSRVVLQDALKGDYLVGAFNFNNIEQMQAIIEAAHETRSPIILQAAWGGVKHIRKEIFPWVVKGGVEYANFLASEDGTTPVPVVLNLDHGGTFEECEACCQLGFSSIMIDGSHHDFDENVRLTAEVVKMARSYDPTINVEGELGIIGGQEEDVSNESKHYTDPAQAEEFTKKTGIDSLAISIGTAHGAKKYEPKDLIKNESGKMVPPPLKSEIVTEIAKIMPDLPLVLHGASAIPEEYVKLFNSYGGTLKEAVGIPDAYVKAMAPTNICKVNIHSDGRLVFMAALKKGLTEKTDNIEERNFLNLGKEEMKKYYMYKMREVLVSAGKA